MHGNILSPSTGQAALTLHDLAEAIRTAHAGVVAGFASAARCAVEAGRELRTAKTAVSHGQWGEFLRTCDLNDRTSRRYMQLADLVQNGRGTTDLTGVSIEKAIKLLAPPKPAETVIAPKQLAPPKQAVTAGPQKHVTHIVVTEVLLAASPVDRIKAIDALGLDALWAAIPPAWLPLIEQRLADRRQVSAPAAINGNLSIPADLSIPDCLHRSPAVIETVSVAPSFLIEPPAPLAPSPPSLFTPNYDVRHDSAFCGPTAISAITGLPISEIRDAIRQASGKVRRSDGSAWPVRGIYDRDLISAMKKLGWRVAEQGEAAKQKRQRLYDFARDHGDAGPFIVSVSRHYVAIGGGEFCDTSTCLPKNIADGVLDRPGFGLKRKGAAQVKHWWRFERAAVQSATAH